MRSDTAPRAPHEPRLVQQRELDVVVACQSVAGEVDHLGRHVEAVQDPYARRHLQRHAAAAYTHLRGHGVRGQVREDEVVDHDQEVATRPPLVPELFCCCRLGRRR